MNAEDADRLLIRAEVWLAKAGDALRRFAEENRDLKELTSSTKSLAEEAATLWTAMAATLRNSRRVECPVCAERARRQAAALAEEMARERPEPETGDPCVSHLCGELWPEDKSRWCGACAARDALRQAALGWKTK